MPGFGWRTLGALHEKAVTTPAKVTAASGANKYTAGFYRTYYTGGWWAKDPTWFNGKTPASTLVTSGFQISLGSGQTLENFMWVGYIKADTTGTWTFINGATIDDSCAVWIGPNAISGYTWANADAACNSADNNSTFSFTKSFVSGTYYPIRVMYGNNSGPGAMGMNFKRPTGGYNSGYSGIAFYNPATNGF